MHLHALLTKDDLAETIAELTPSRVVMSSRPQRVVTIDKPDAVELVRGKGLRVRGAAQLVWEVAGFPISCVVRAWQVLLVPAVRSAGNEHHLAFEPIIEVLDLQGVLGFVDGRIANAVSDALAEHHRRLAWRFGETLSVRLTLPPHVTPGGSFELFPTGGEVSVTENAVSLTVFFAKRVTRAPAVRDDAPRKPAHHRHA